jgi:beta-lactamase class A
MHRSLILTVLLCAPAALAETAVQHLLEDKMFSRLKEYDATLRGSLGVATIDLTSGRVFVYNGEAGFPMASTIKIPIMVEMFKAAKRGEFKFTDQITLERSELVGGSGTLQKALEQGPKSLSVLELVTAMMEHSDNTATNRAIRMARMERVNRSLVALGFRTTRLRRLMMDAPAAARGDENTASPVEMARYVEMLYRRRLADPEQTAQMIGIMKLVKGDVRSILPAGIETATKTGSVPGVQCEVGIVYLANRPFVLSVFSTFLEDGVRPVGEVTKIVFDYFAKLAQSNDYGHRIR